MDPIKQNSRTHARVSSADDKAVGYSSSSGSSNVPLVTSHSRSTTHYSISIPESEKGFQQNGASAILIFHFLARSLCVAVVFLSLSLSLFLSFSLARKEGNKYIICACVCWVQAYTRTRVALQWCNWAAACARYEISSPRLSRRAARAQRGALCLLPAKANEWGREKEREKNREAVVAAAEASLLVSQGELRSTDTDMTIGIYWLACMPLVSFCGMRTRARWPILECRFFFFCERERKVPRAALKFDLRMYICGGEVRRDAEWRLSVSRWYLERNSWRWIGRVIKLLIWMGVGTNAMTNSNDWSDRRGLIPIDPSPLKQIFLFDVLASLL